MTLSSTNKGISTMVNGTLLNFGKRYEDNLRVIFDQWSKLHSRSNAQPKITILKVTYYLGGYLVAPGFPPKTLILLWFRNLPPLLNFMSNESARFIENKVLFFYHIMYRILNSSRINMIMETIL